MEVSNVGGWLTHVDLVLLTEVDFLAVAEHRLIPARVRLWSCCQVCVAVWARSAFALCGAVWVSGC